MPRAPVDYFSYAYVTDTGTPLSIPTRKHILNLHILFLSTISDFSTEDNSGVCQGLLYLNFSNPLVSVVIHSSLIATK